MGSDRSAWVSVVYGDPSGLGAWAPPLHIIIILLILHPSLMYLVREHVSMLMTRAMRHTGQMMHLHVCLL